MKCSLSEGAESWGYQRKVDLEKRSGFFMEHLEQHAVLADGTIIDLSETMRTAISQLIVRSGRFPCSDFW
jgi:hypothetical protein